jgi:ABC-type nickel/cobalt efflux system permease component RcnA
MAKLLTCLLILLPLICGAVVVKAQNPFLSPKSSPQSSSKSFQPVPQPSAPQSSFLTKITLWQLQLKEKMTVLVRQAKTTESITPWLTLLMIAFGYGALHAAGPGHGKAVAISFISSRNASLGSGLLFGSLIAFCHGFSGIICVLGIYYFLEGGISGSLGTVSHITQTVSYSLIALLGFGIFVKNSRALLFKSKPKSKPKLEADTDYGAPGASANYVKESKWALVLWALTVGVVPCPGVIMVLLFCLSLNLLGLGLWLAVFISLGMATTISLVVVSVVLGRGISLKSVSEKRVAAVEKVLGVVSGMAITVLGLLFLSMS